MMNNIKEAIWVAKALFERNKVSGSTANLSFKLDGKIYITGTGTSFGRLDENSFSIIEDDQIVNNIKPSKELELHRIMFESNEDIQAIIHTHSTYITYWSCVSEPCEYFKIPSPTPYIDIKVGKIGWVKYEHPGSKELFDAFSEVAKKGNKAYVMENHGVIVGGATLMEAFNMLEEIEEASLNAYLLQKK